MIYLTLLMVTVFSATQTAYGTQTDLKTRVAQQVERIKLNSGHSEFGYGELPEPFPPDDSAPVPQLIKYLASSLHSSQIHAKGELPRIAVLNVN